MSTLRQTREIVAMNLRSIPQRWGQSGVFARHGRAPLSDRAPRGPERSGAVARHCRAPLSARAGMRGPGRGAMDSIAECHRELP
jgi:hypothetical protein